MVNQVLALDIGGTNMRAAIVKSNKIIDRTSIPTPKNKKTFLKNIDNLLEKYYSKKIKRIGVGIAGIIENGIVKKSPNLPINNFDLKKYIQKKYQTKVNIKNDAGCFTLAEQKLGCKAKNFILITLGTGIGGGIVINGEEYRGSGDGAEFGHMHFKGGEWEKQWQATRERINKSFGKNTMFSDLAKAKNPKAEKILEESAEYLGIGIASLITEFDPEFVIIGGGPKESGKPFMDLIKKNVKKYSFLKKATPVQWTKLSEPGILGASLLI